MSFHSKDKLNVLCMDYTTISRMMITPIHGWKLYCLLGMMIIPYLVWWSVIWNSYLFWYAQCKYTYFAMKFIPLFLLVYLKLRNFRLPVGKLRNNTPPIGRSPGIPLLLHSLVLLGLVFCIALQQPSLPWSPFFAVCDIIRMKQTELSAVIMALRMKTE